MRRHFSAKEKPYDFPREYKDNQVIVYPSTGERQYQAVQVFNQGKDLLRTMVLLKRDEKIIFQVDAGETNPVDTIRGLWVDGSHWTLELASTVDKPTGKGVNGQIFQMVAVAPRP